MENSFARVKSIISRLREVLKCQKCFQMKEENSMMLYHACDHFYCTDCVNDEKACPLCLNPHDKPSRVIDDKNILSLYQSLKNFELPSKHEIDKIYKGHKEFKEEKLKDNLKEVDDRDLVLETPKHRLKHRAGLRQEKEVELLTSNGSNFDTIILSTSGNKKSKQTIDIPSSSGKRKNETPKRGRSGGPVSAAVATTPVVTPARVVNIAAGSNKGSNSVSKTNINKRNPKGETQLHLACKKANFSLMADLIAAGANPNAQDNAGWTPLHDSVFSGNLEVIKFLLDNGARINTPGLENTTALHEAIAKGNVQIVKLLLEQGADINAMNIFRETPLDLVIKYKLHDMKKVLLETTSNVKTVSEATNFEELDEKFILYKYNLSIEDEKLVNKFVEHFQADVTSALTSKIPSHIILPQGKVELTWALISSVPNGCWVPTIDWVRDSLKDRNIKLPKNYEPSSLVGFSRARKNKEQQLPRLFSGCHFFFGGNFEEYTVRHITIGKNELKSFVERNGGAILKRCPDPESLALEKTVPFHALHTSSLRDTAYFIIYQTEKWDPKPKYNMSHMKTLPIEWFLGCILQFELIDPKEKESLWSNLY